MNEYQYRQWCRAVEELMKICQIQHLRFGNELTPEQFVEKVRLSIAEMRKLIETDGK